MSFLRDCLCSRPTHSLKTQRPVTFPKAPAPWDPVRTNYSPSPSTPPTPLPPPPALASVAPPPDSQEDSEAGIACPKTLLWPLPSMELGGLSLLKAKDLKNCSLPAPEGHIPRVSALPPLTPPLLPDLHRWSGPLSHSSWLCTARGCSWHWSLPQHFHLGASASQTGTEVQGNHLPVLPPPSHLDPGGCRQWEWQWKRQWPLGGTALRWETDPCAPTPMPGPSRHSELYPSLSQPCSF